MTNGSPIPLPFWQAVEEVYKAAPGNATVRRLTALQQNNPKEYENKMNEIKDMLHSMNMKKFVPMVRNQMQANTAVVLYAGDGMVVKITSSSFVPEKFLYHVLPPIHRYTIKSRDASESFKLEVFPWLDTHAITQKDVEEMANELAKDGVSFTRGDDRPDNLGRLPDGKCAILDNNATDFSINNRELKDVHRWTHYIHGLFGKLYTSEAVNGKELPLVSDNPDFKLRLSPLVPARSRIRTSENATEVASVPPGNLRRRVAAWIDPSLRDREGGR